MGKCNFRRYQKADRRRKGRNPHQFVEETLCTRAHAALVLRCRGTERWGVGPRGPLRFITGLPRPARRPPPRRYGQAVKAALTRL